MLKKLMQDILYLSETSFMSTKLRKPSPDHTDHVTHHVTKLYLIFTQLLLIS